jgi:hypothetical protein
MQMVSQRTRIGALSVAVFVTATAMTLGLIAPSLTPSASTNPQYVHGAAALPYLRLKDWHSFADGVVAFTVKDERRVPASDEEYEANVGLETRLLVASIDEVIWTRDKSRQIPETMTFPHGGWTFSAHQENHRIFLADSIDLLVGHSYVAPIYYDETQDDALKWMPLAPDSIVSASNGRTNDLEPILSNVKPDGTVLDSARKLVTNQTFLDIRAFITTAPAYRVTREVTEESARSRYKSVLESEEYKLEQASLE